MHETFNSIDKIICIVIAIIGVSVNFLAIMILSRGKCGLSTCTTRYLVAMAMADLLVIIIEVILSRINEYFFPINFLDITHVCRTIYALSGATIACSVWFTVTFTFDRFVSICCQKFKRIYCTKKTAAAVLTTICVIFCLESIPLYYRTEPGEIFDNLPWFCFINPNTYIKIGWVIFNWCDMILTPLFPFAFILLINGLTVRHILLSNRARNLLKTEGNSRNSNDPEIDSRRKSVLLLFTISGSFILLWLTHVFDFIYCSIAGIDVYFGNDTLYVVEQVGIMLRNLSCCSNTFIYAVIQSKFRKQLKCAIKYPVTSTIQFLSKKGN